MSDTTSTPTPCTKCGRDIGTSSLLIGGRLYHHECSPYDFRRSPITVTDAEVEDALDAWHKNESRDSVYAMRAALEAAMKVRNG